MGLFSGSFGTGLVTGLATSVDKSLNDAMDKRDEELSAARRFWQTRQAQKLDLAEAEDARSEKALNRMINEANGDVALGFAAYQAAGGDADSVEKFIARMDSTRAAKGEFSLTDALVLPEGFKAPDVTREQAFGAIRTPIKGVSAEAIDIDDPLANIGLGLRGGAANKVADKINNMIPPQEVTRIEGFEGVQLDMSKMLEAEEYARNKEVHDKAMGPDTFDEQLFDLSNKRFNLKREDFESDEAFNIERDKLDAQFNNIAARKAKVAALDANLTSGASDSILRVSWKDAKSYAYADMGLGGKAGEEYYIDADTNQVVFKITDPDGYAAREKQAIRSAARSFVNTQGGTDGSFTQSALNIINTDAYLQEAYQDILGEEPEVALGEEPSAPVFDTPEAIAADPAGFADSLWTSGVKLTPQNQSVLAGKLKQANPELSDPEIIQIVKDSVSKAQEIRAKQAAETSAFDPSVFEDTSDVPETPITVDDQGRKTMDGVTWNPNETPTMVDVARNQNVPMNVRIAAFEDLVIKQNMNDATITRLKSQYGLD